MIIIAYGSNKFSLDHLLKSKSEWDLLIKKNCASGDIHCRRKQRQAILQWAYNPFIWLLFCHNTIKNL
jgi:hypothetical protein